MRDKDLPVRGVPGKVVLGIVGKAVDDRWDDAQRAAGAASGRTARERADDVTSTYLRQLTALGAAAGGTAAVPGVGTLTALGATAVELGAFAHRATEMILAIGAAHGHTGAGAEERKSWVLAVLGFGGRATAELGAMTAALGAGLTAEAGGGGGWFRAVNRFLGRRLLNRWGTRRMLGKLLPFGIGAAFGAGTNYAVAKRIARNADRFFAELPRWEPGRVVSAPTPTPALAGAAAR